MVTHSGHVRKRLAVILDYIIGERFDSSGSYTGSKSQQVSIEMSLNIYSPAYKKTVTRTYDVAAAVSGAVNGKKFSMGSSQDPWVAWNSCINKGGRLATKDGHHH